ncbi:Rhs family protein [Labilithrix luteola]|uniref:Rhs family protein n=1 Tax=Labilithrix luteola TaxID=1391654 RepID=A0A0K1QDS4_9BACT|nr:FG-GAP-like repeat-containing protein [Labilithrix luteola]AKV03926.1 Rhs family protein [Labilithrix luteola]
MRRARAASAVLFATLATASCNEVTPEPLVTAPIVAPEPAFAGPHDVFVVAHQDDDLLFLSPDIGAAIADPQAALTIYLTAGDAGRTDPTYYLERENGVLAAYASLAGAKNPHWTETTMTVHGHPLLVRTLAEATVSIVFMRLPDGGGDGNGYPTSLGTYDGSLRRLWRGEIPSLSAVDDSTSYDREDLVETLEELFVTAQPSRISTLDASGAFGSDHSDHVHAALFTSAATPDGVPLRLYRGYNIRREVPNLAADESSSKWNAFLAYAAHDSAICGSTGCNSKILDGYSVFATRQYLSCEQRGGNGAITNTEGLCLGVDATTALVATPCTGSPLQRFSLRANGFLVGASRQCVTADPDGIARMHACAPTDDPSPQRWSLLSGGNLLEERGGCLRHAESGTAVLVGDCDQNPASQWVVGFDRARVVSRSDAYQGRRLLAGDLDGDHHADLCATHEDGIICALTRNGTLGTPTLATTSFSDRDGFADPAKAATLALADVDGDKIPDLCGWSGRPMCAKGTGRGTFAIAAPVRAGDLGALDPSSVAFVDVDGDGFADLCSAGKAGVACAVNNRKGGFGSALFWHRGPLTDAADTDVRWLFADVTGDGRADVCQIVPSGVECASARWHGQGFERSRRWFQVPAGTTFSPESVVFGDIDGDHAADLCSFSAAGVSCATSTGSTFGSLFVRVRAQPNDASWTRLNGWLADVDGDGRADACHVGSSATLCARAP